MRIRTMLRHCFSRDFIDLGSKLPSCWYSLLEMVGHGYKKTFSKYIKPGIAKTKTENCDAIEII